MALAACSAGPTPKAVGQPSAVATGAEPNANTAVETAVVVPTVTTANVAPSEAARLSFPESQAEFDALSFAQRLRLAHAGLDALMAGRAARTEAYAPALSLARSIPIDAPEYLESRAVARSLEAFRPTDDDIVASTPPEQRLGTALYIISQAFKDPTRTDLVGVAQKFIDAIPADLPVDQEKLITARNAILVLRADSADASVAAGQVGPLLPESPISPDAAGIPYAPSAGPGSCAGCSSYPKTVRVREYTRRDGTTVHEHTRSAPRR